MARMRSVKPEFWADEDLALELCRDARLLYIGLWNLADEHGRLRGDPRYIKGQLFPYDDDLSVGAVDALLDQVAEHGRAIRYKVSGRSYLFLPKLARHQRLEEKVPSRLPSLDEADADKPHCNETPNADVSARDANKSARDTDDSARDANSSARAASAKTDESPPSPQPPATTDRANKSASDADQSALKQVAGSRRHVAGGIEHGAGKSEIAPRSSDATPPREDVERLCTHLADRIERNDVKRPAVDAQWRDAARLLLDADGYPEKQIHAVIDWCQTDSFWRAHIQSMPTLRNKYGQLKLASEHTKRPQTTNRYTEPGAGDDLGDVFG